MGEAEEVECRALPAPSGPVRSEVQVPRLVRVEPKLVPGEPLAQNGEHSLAVPVVLEEHHGVIGISDEQASPLQAWLHFSLEPLVQHVVQESCWESRHVGSSLQVPLDTERYERNSQHDWLGVPPYRDPRNAIRSESRCQLGLFAADGSDRLSTHVCRARALVSRSTSA